MLQAIIAGIVTFILTLVGIPAFIRFYHKAHISGQQMHEDVKQHQAKAGTPTMGGTVFLLASVLSSFVIALISRDLSSSALMILFILVLYGIIILIAAALLVRCLSSQNRFLQAWQTERYTNPDTLEVIYADRESS